MATTDPSRAPHGSESAWAYLHAPHRGSAPPGRRDRDVLDGRRLDEVADEVETRIAEYAPEFGERVLDRRVLGPAQLQARDENLVGGAVNGGTAAIHQQLVWRPVTGWGRAETPVRNLYLASASAHPGGGVHGAPGANAARAAIAHDRARAARQLNRRTPRWWAVGG